MTNITPAMAKSKKVKSNAYLASAGAMFLALLLGACAPHSAKTKAEALTPKQVKKLDRYLANKTPGKPRHCITDRNHSTIRISDKILLYRASGSLVYRNNLQATCRGLVRDDDIIVIRKWGGASALCRGDLFHLLDPISGIRGASCKLGDFIPYRKTANNKQQEKKGV